MAEFKPFEMIMRMEYGGAVADGDAMKVCILAKTIAELVRCKDCKYREQEEIGMVYCPNVIGGWTPNDWFCADGERKDG